ncbi:DUF3999 family protein [Cellulophaga sp. Z1A5H]|uniref:DUF3999 family protein n=1 Tax=Cellulophaga sp. Z1A5H TaxID=2687291 RepID=UPI0013FD13A8|nr:DUF3999 family protein [Cellulophaga sp. Z1A5H]
MTQKTYKLLFILFLVSSGLFAQMKTYQFKREIKDISEQWQRIELPESLYGKTKMNLADIRIYGITKKDTIEAPYALKATKSIEKIDDVAFELINESHTEDNYFYTFKIDNDSKINEIYLNFEQLNFDFTIKVEGGHNDKEWYTIKEDYRILSIENGITSFNFTTAKIPTSTYSYYRITANTSEDPELKSAKIFENNTIPAEYNTYVPFKTEITKNQKTKESVVTVELKNAVPLSHIKVNILDNVNYLRPIHISYVSDSIKTTKGWHYEYRSLASSILSSINKNEFDFISTRVKKLKITISNQDNEALKVGTIQLKGYKHELIARFNQPAQYFLTYGNPTASEPIYDINLMDNVVPKTAKTVALGKELSSEAKIQEPEAKPLFEDKKWLWAIMILIISLIGYYTIKMIKKT